MKHGILIAYDNITQNRIVCLIRVTWNKLYEHKWKNATAYWKDLYLKETNVLESTEISVDHSTLARSM